MSDVTLIDRPRIDAFKQALYLLCVQYDLDIVRFRTHEDHAMKPPEIEIELVQRPANKVENRA